MSYYRGILLAGRFRTQFELNRMFDDGQRNTLIATLVGLSNQSVSHYQAMNVWDLCGVGAARTFLRETKGRTDAELQAMTDDDVRNTLIVAMHAQTGTPVPTLQGMTDLNLALLGLGSDRSFIRGALLVGRFRTMAELLAMSAEDQRNTLIVTLAGLSNQPVSHYQAMSDQTLGGAGAALVFLREAKIRDDAALKAMSDDDVRNTMIVEAQQQTNTDEPVDFFQGLDNLDIIQIVLGADALVLH
ncbi:hypothetical protein [Limnoglobus roseus]|uniref:Uncharacterized protein n=1 Tax=Limnoglobus roseus TaxID=2598579 RepID=A0A5C1A793_9BACT|nr:hypothetical protein [Limnoglobus roseus]QEL14153.1 hypothetical protein PX52LOC_01023 [Limnoglobus roseus]